MKKIDQYGEGGGAIAAIGRSVLLAGFLAFVTIALWLNFAKSLPAVSSSLVPADTLPANVEAFLKAIPQAERDALVAREEKILLGNPLDVQAHKNLIMLYAIAGEKEKSDAFILVAAKRSLRDLPLQAAAINIQLNKQNFGDALYRMDALIRSKPAFSKDFFGTMMSFATVPAAKAELVRKLAENPPWRVPFMNYFTAQTTEPDLVYGVYSALKKLGQTVATSELKQLLQRLLKDQAFDKASFIWLDYLNETELRKAGLLYDGGFDLEFGNRFFDWTETKIKNADVRIVPRATGSADKVLRVDFAPARTPFNNFSQILRLTPGDYIFAGEQKSEKLESNSGMIWQISCEGATKTVLLETTKLQGTLPWAAFSNSFKVPQENCPAQRLALRLNAKAALDQQVSGQVFFDGLSIARAVAAE